MTADKFILLVSNSHANKELYQMSIQERNEFENTRYLYSITEHVPSIKEAKEKIAERNFDGMFVDTTLSDGSGLDFTTELLISEQQNNILLFCEPKEIEESQIALRKWNEDYPLSNIGLVIKPIQASVVWDYLRSCEQALPSFEMNMDWEDWGVEDVTR